MIDRWHLVIENFMLVKHNLNMKAVFAAVILCAIMLGILVSPYFDVSSLSLFALFGIFFILSISFIPQKWLWISMIAIAFFFLGVLRFQSYQASFENITYPTGENIKIEGQIAEPPDQTDKSVQAVLADNGKKAKILLVLKPFTNVHYGDYVTVQGNIEKPADNKKNSLLVKGIAYEMAFPVIAKSAPGEMSAWMRLKGALYGIRNRFENSINSTFPEPEASFLAGLLLGIKRNLPNWLTQDLQKSGTTHLIALSGFNITVIIEGLRLIFKRKSAKLSFYMPLAAIIAFVIMTGSSSSVVRAGVMGAMMMLAYRIGRQSSATMAIIISAAIMVILNPFILRFDVGFQLSFAAFIGIVYLAPLIKSVLKIKNEFIKDMLAMTAGAQVMAYPLIIYYFGTFSLVSFAANLVILPFIPFVMLLGFISVVIGMVWQGFGLVFSWTALFALKSIIWAIHFFASLPFAAVSGISISFLSAVIYYIIVLELIFIIKRLRRRRLAN